VDGQYVQQGQLLLEMESPDLLFQYHFVRSQVELLRWQEHVGSLSPSMRAQLQVIRAQRQQKETELLAVGGRLERFRVAAPVEGRFYFSNPDMGVEGWVGHEALLGVLCNTDDWRVETYLPEEELGRVKEGDVARFFPETAGMNPLHLKVVRIDRDVSRVIGEGMLVSTRGGTVPVREVARGHFIPEQAVYRVTLAMDPKVEPFEGRHPLTRRGMVVISGERRAHAEAFLKAIGSLLVKESGF
jgi:putative peptide zinc metalloprotease protein